MPYRPRKTTHSTTGATPLASKMSAMPATGAWVHDAETGITSYTANPSQYLDSDEKTKGKPRFKVLYGKRTPKPKRKAWKPDPKVYAASIGALYPIAGDDPSTSDKPTRDQAAHIDARLANSDPYFNIKQVVREPKRHFNKTSEDVYAGIAWLILKDKF